MNMFHAILSFSEVGHYSETLSLSNLQLSKRRVKLNTVSESKHVAKAVVLKGIGPRQKPRLILTYWT